MLLFYEASVPLFLEISLNFSEKTLMLSSFAFIQNAFWKKTAQKKGELFSHFKNTIILNVY